MKKIIVSLFVSLMIVTNVGADSIESVFTDVSDATDYSAAIQWMAENKVINGYADSSFKPDKCVNRAEFLKMLFVVQEAELSSVENLSFSDVDNSAWYAPYLATALQTKIVEGYEDGTFKPEQCVTRAEAAKMVVVSYRFPVNLAKHFDYDYETQMSTWHFIHSDYTDVDVKAWYYEYLGRLLEFELIGIDHVEKNGFGPNKDMSRKEVAELLYRVKLDQDNIFYYRERSGHDISVPRNVLNESYGVIEGSLTYPSEWIPDELVACAKNLDTDIIYFTKLQYFEDNKYKYHAGYKLRVPAGEYSAYGWYLVGSESYTYFPYTEYVKCGMDYETCKDKSIIEFTVKENETVFDMMADFDTVTLDDPGDY